VIISSTTITSTFSGGKGGLVYSNSPGMHSLSITGSTIKYTESVDKGGIFYPDLSSNVQISVSASTFTGVKSRTLGSFVSIDSLTGLKQLSIALSTSTFTCIDQSIWATFPTVYNTAVTLINTPSAPNIGGAFYI
jgi:hypothetical protein